VPQAPQWTLADPPTGSTSAGAERLIIDRGVRLLQ
jgi:hypothetical protein